MLLPMTTNAIIGSFIPDLLDTVKEEEQYDWYSGGNFILFRIVRKNNSEHRFVCLLQVTDIVPEPFWGSRAVEAINAYFGQDVVGCFLAGSGAVLAIDDSRLVAGRLPTTFDGEPSMYDQNTQYYLYLLSGPPSPSGLTGIWSENCRSKKRF